MVRRTNQVSVNWETALADYDRDLRARGAAERTRRAYAVDLAGFVEWVGAAGARAGRRPPPRRAPLRRRALLGRRGAGDGRPQAGRDPRPLRLPRPHRAGRAEPGRAGLQPEALGEAAEGAHAPSRCARCWSGSRPARRWSCATGRCSSWPTPAACAARRSSTSTQGALDFETEQLRVLGKGSKERILPVGEPAQRALERYLERGRRALADRSARAGAVPLQERPPPLQLRRHPPPRPLDPRGGDGRRRLAALTSPFIRHPSARGWRRSAYDSGAARPRIDLDHPGLHPSRCRPPA